MNKIYSLLGANMKDQYFEFQDGTINHYNKNQSCGTILNSKNEQIYFFLSDLSRLSNNSIVGMKVSYSQVRNINNESWASVIVEDQNNH